MTDLLDRNKDISEFIETLLSNESSNFLAKAYESYEVSGGYYRLKAIVEQAIERVRGIISAEAIIEIIKLVELAPVEPLDRLLAHHVNQFIYTTDEAAERDQQFRESQDMLLPLQRLLPITLIYAFNSAFIAVAEEQGIQLRYNYASQLTRNDYLSYVGENNIHLLDRLKYELTLWRDIYMTDDNSIVTLGLQTDRFCACNCPNTTHCLAQLARRSDRDILIRLRNLDYIPDRVINPDGEIELPLGVIKTYASDIINVEPDFR